MVRNMKIKECLLLADECGLETIDEAMRNVLIHASNLFVYDKMVEELTELQLYFDDLLLTTNFTEESNISEVLSYLESNEDKIITVDNICDNCWTNEDECGEYRECCYKGYLRNKTTNPIAKNSTEFMRGGVEWFDINEMEINEK